MNGMSVSDRVKRGMRLLAEVDPLWFMSIDADKLDLGSMENGILEQLGEGFCVNFSHNNPTYHVKELRTFWEYNGFIPYSHDDRWLTWQWQGRIKDLQKAYDNQPGLIASQIDA